MTTNGLYIQMFSLHGLVRSHNMELGYDADTGGQIKYVIELGKALSQHKEIGQVDLFTRLISDKAFSEDYSQAIETVNEKFRLIRIQCGGKKYIRKELLWPHLDEYVANTVKFIRQHRSIPDIVHGHYADGGYVAKELSKAFGLPFVFTGHSLGRSKKERLLAQGTHEGVLNRQLKIDHRIEMEEQILRDVDLVVTSTKQEVETQYDPYLNNDQPEYQVIPPGICIEKFEPFYYGQSHGELRSEEAMFANASLLNELDRFFQNPEKPIILMLCRPDKRKNIEGLIQAFGEDHDLQAIANLAIFAGIRKDIAQQEEGAREVLTRMLLLMDKYNLYGKMAIPKKHDFENEVPELYRIAAERRGVFVNPALTEPFGLTLLEASATGLPVVATNDGGPRDILENCQSGILVDPGDPHTISRAIKDILVHENRWEEFSKNGILNTRKHYTWESHAHTFSETIHNLVDQHRALQKEKVDQTPPVGVRIANLAHMLITDIDNTLLGGAEEPIHHLMTDLKKHRNHLGFGVATGRVLESAVAVLEKNKIMPPDIIISGVGSEIHYGPNLERDKGWEALISKNWKREKIVSTLKAFDFLTLQDNEVQRPYKISYHMAPDKDRLAMIHNLLARNRCRYQLIYSHEKYLDILPARASKGKAIRYISRKWEIPLTNILVCGDSGNDEEMLKGEPKAVVVGNYSPELEPLKSSRNVYFAHEEYAKGMLEGILYYGFLEDLKPQKKDPSLNIRV